MRRIAWRRRGRTKNDGTNLRSRGALRPSFPSHRPSSRTEGAGKTGCLANTHGPRAKKMHGAGTTGMAVTSGLPCAMVLRLIRALPGDQALLSPSPRIIERSLTPAQGRQDHTISPSASRHSSLDAPRPSHPASNVRDDREAPLVSRKFGRMSERAVDQNRPLLELSP